MDHMVGSDQAVIELEVELSKLSITISVFMGPSVFLPQLGENLGFL